MKRSEMIKDKKYFNHIINDGMYNKDRNFVIYYVQNNDNEYTHFGIAIKKSIGKAYIRNRLKRQTRALIDNNKKVFKKDRDYIIMIRKGCLESNYDEMNSSINNIMKGN